MKATLQAIGLVVVLSGAGVHAEQPISPEAAWQGAGVKFDIAFENAETDRDGYLKLRRKPEASKDQAVQELPPGLWENYVDRGFYPNAIRATLKAFDKGIDRLVFSNPSGRRIGPYERFWEDQGKTLGPAGGAVSGLRRYGLLGAVGYAMLGRVVGPWSYGWVGRMMDEMKDAGLMGRH